jgi:heme O synthase-like polyprenyltransferase
MEQFYLIAGASNILVYVLAVIELAVILAFLFAQKSSYGLVLLMQAVSTLASYKQYLHPFQPPNRLFFAAIPMLAACFTLYYLRDADVL